MSKTEEDIFCDALEIPISNRKEFVRQASEGDVALCTAVERLLQLHDTEDGFLATPAIGLGEADIEEQPGDVIGSFRLDKKIGEGGFGIIWQADQLEPVKRRVAIKIFKLGRAADKIVRRFDEERQTLAIMNHPNIATVFDAGTTSRGRSFFAMELVEGTSIDKYCNENDLSLAQQLNLFASVCRAVQHAHQKGVVHLDLKPSNILVADQDGQPLVKIIDFGIARAVQNVGTELTADSNLTSSGDVEQFQRVGTLEYMSPEQMDAPAEVDTRSDIYSLGAVLYKLLAGVTPLGLSALGNPAGLTNSFRLIRETVPPAPSWQREKRTTSSRGDGSENEVGAKEIPRDLDYITLKALQKEPESRYQSANEFAKDVERYLSCQIVSAVPRTLPYTLRKFVLRNRLFVVASILVILATIGGLVSMTIGLVQADKQRSIAIRERQEAERLRNLAVQEAEEARLVASLLEQLVGGANPEAGLPANFSLREQLDEFAVWIDDRLEKYPEVESRLRHVIGRAYSSLRVLEKAGPNLRRALELRLRVFKPDHPQVLESRLELARFLVFDAKPGEARIQVEWVLAELESLEPSLELAKAHHVLSEINSNTGQAVETFLSAERAWQVATAAAGPNDLLALDYQSRAGFCAIRVESLERAEELSSDALNRLEKHWPDRTFQINRAKGRLVTVYNMQKRFEESLPLINQVIQENANQLGSESHFHVTAMLTKVTILRHLNRREDAEELLWESAAVADRATNERSRAQTMAYRRLAEWVQREDRPAEAEVLWSKATDARRRMDGDTGRVGQELIIRGYLLRELGRHQEAEQCLTEAVDVLRSLPQPKKNYLVSALFHLADQKLELKLSEEALGPLREAVALAEEVARPVVYPHIDFIQALIMSEDVEQARRQTREWEVTAEKQGDEILAVIVDVADAQIEMSMDDFESASERLLTSIQLLQPQSNTIGSRRLLTRINDLLAECYLETGEFLLAQNLLLNTVDNSPKLPTSIASRRAKRLLVLLFQSWGKVDQANYWKKRLHQQ